MIAYLVAIFVGAFLLFQVQPIMARYILPWYGGTPAVWTTCMLFFQVGLVGGYGYAHILGRRLPPRRQALIHLVVLGLSLLLLPITPDDSWKPVGQQSAALKIMLLLFVTIGAPYVLLASTSPLMQYWFSRSRPGASPYRLYALSNLGSLLGLLTYPFVVEPLLAVDAQTVTWSIAYGAFALASVACAVPILRRRWSVAPSWVRPEATGVDSPPSGLDVLAWLALTATGSIMLLAVTNRICQDVAVVPFLWILPLSLYLLTFILTFEDEQVYKRRIWGPLFLIALVVTVFLILQDESDALVPISVEVLVNSAMLFTACMICHGELVRRKPPARHLTSFYMMVAIGGAMGGLFVNLVAPYIFSGFWEFHVGLAATYVLLGVFALRRTSKVWRIPRQLSRLLWLAGGVVLVIFLAKHIDQERGSMLAMKRNFYGVLRVYDYYGAYDDPMRSLLHGRISHGAQYLDEEYRRQPITYYGETSGIAMALQSLEAVRSNQPPLHGPPPDTSLNLGVVGLGAGCMAAYGREGDRLTFYEINPDVVDFARRYFYYLSDTPADVSIVLGDARLSMERELRTTGGHEFDVLVVDAFSGDAIPVHLLTKEASDVYWRHIRTDGVLAVHITNRHIDLRPIVKALADAAGKQALHVASDDDDETEAWGADWVLISGNADFLDEIRKSDVVTPWPPEMEPRLWTDKFSNLLSVLQ